MSDVDTHPINVLSLFSGGAGLDRGVRCALPNARVVCYVEREAYPIEVLASRMEDGALDEAPIWTDVATFDGNPWRGVVDIIVGGFPCVGISNAGKRKGLDDPRSGLWREFARIVDEVRPSLVFIENVAPLVKRGLDRVLADLNVLGFDAEWDCFTATEVGAPHRRNRIFILAYSLLLLLRNESRRRGGESGRHSPELGVACEAMADADSARFTSVRGNGLQATSGLRDADGRNMPFPPSRDDVRGWREYLRRYPSLEPAVCRGTHGLAHRSHRLRMLGNGVVTAQAAYAFHQLWRRVETHLASSDDRRWLADGSR